MTDMEKILEEIEAWMGEMLPKTKEGLAKYFNAVLNDAWNEGYERGYNNGLYDGGKE